MKGSSAHNSMVVSDEERRCVKERPSSLSDGRSLSSPAISTSGAGSMAAAKTVVSAVVHPQTPGGHSRANKVRSDFSIKDGQCL